MRRVSLRGSRLAERWTSARSGLLLVAVVASTFLACYLSTIKYRPLFAPDSTYYAAMSLRFGGVSTQEAIRQVNEVRVQSGWPALDQMFGWGLVQPRVVLPLLSVPFVKIWGIDGLAVVPGLALAALVGVLTWMLARRWGGAAAAATVLLIICSPRIIFFGSAMLTESLSALWGALTLVAAWRYQRRPGWQPVVWMVGLTVVSAFTRQATLVVAGAMVTAWLCALVLRRRPNGWGVPALGVGVTSVAVQLLQTKLFPFYQVNQFEAKTGTDSLSGALAEAPRLAAEIAQKDLVFIAQTDRALLVFVLLSVLSMVIFWRRAESHLLLGAILGITLYSVTNGTPTGFRYAMPGVAFFAVSVALLIGRVDLHPTRSPGPEIPTGASPGSSSLQS